MAPAQDHLSEKVAVHLRENCLRYFGERAAAVGLFGREDVDYWSVIHVYTVETSSGKRHIVYCKVPKSRWGLRAAEGLGQDPAGAKMAAVEFSSLRFLSEMFTNSIPSLRVIRALDLLREPSAILSEGVNGSSEVFRRLRHADRVTGERPAALDLVRKCGRWLAHLHGRSTAGASLDRLPAYAAQLDNISAAVEGIRRREGVGPFFKYLEEARRLAVDEGEETYTAEGFEVRNFIAKDGTIYFLDPGKIALGPPYEDLARFLISLAILYWGQLRLLRKSEMEDSYARAFLEGYEGERGPVRRGLLRVYLIKEYLKLWLEGLEVLHMKRQLAPLRWFGRRVYLPIFFSKRINAELALAPFRAFP
jgi:aminoglycoside phosphotransferase (APT) family kinase protein